MFLAAQPVLGLLVTLPTLQGGWESEKIAAKEKYKKLTNNAEVKESIGSHKRIWVKIYDEKESGRKWGKRCFKKIICEPFKVLV